MVSQYYYCKYLLGILLSEEIGRTTKRKNEGKN